MKPAQNIEDIACVILAGGRGSRMASEDLHKVCFPIAGKPAIVRAIDTYKAAGLRKFLIVVGQKSEQVISTVSQAHSEVSFVYQSNPRGTGHAALVAAEALAAHGHSGSVMIVMGDKMTRPAVVRNVIKTFRQGQSDVVVTTISKQASPTSGRVLTDASGKVLGIVELADIKQAKSKRAKLQVGGAKLTAAQLENRCKTINASMYLFRFDPMLKSLKRLQTSNAQGELYLTDTIESISRTGKVETMLVPDPNDLMAFNTPAELLAIEQVVLELEKPPRVSRAGKKPISSRALKPASQWLGILDDDSDKWRAVLRKTYGTDQTLISDRCKAMRRLVIAFIKQHGPDRKMILCRAPGRINLMGRHVDHQGGFVNVMAISREVILAAGPRNDDVVSLRNVEPRQFPSRAFRIFDLLNEASWSDWMDFVDSHVVRSVLSTAVGDWSHYARAPLLRLQHECPQIELKGMDCMISGDIPIGAGLSSSSAIVVAFAEAAVALNRLDVAMRDFVDLCGEGEWFVGSRGGSCDHAAIRTGRIGHISHIGFFPFRMDEEVRFPSKLRVVVAYSGSKAVKSAGARDVFNQRVACYKLVKLFLMRHWPAAAGIEHLRDLIPENLQIKPGDIYRAITQLPSRPSRKQLAEILGNEVEEIFTSHANVGNYDLRGVILYGLGEISRSHRFAESIRAGDWRKVGRFMEISHDGDRLVKFDDSGQAKKFIVRTDDAQLNRLAEADTDLADQPGRYSCSTEAIDQLVDISQATEGVIGAQLAGAGLGGCMMILVRSDAMDRLMSNLRNGFYRPRKINFAVYPCVPVAGAGLLAIGN